MVQLMLGAERVLSYTGYVLLAGTITFWLLVWPNGRNLRRLVGLAMAGGCSWPWARLGSESPKSS